MSDNETIKEAMMRSDEQQQPQPRDDDDNDNAGDNSNKPSLKERTSALWGNLRTAVSKETGELQRMMRRTEKVQYFSKPLCIEGSRCKRANDAQHMHELKHACPYGIACANRYNYEHYNDFVHETLTTGEGFIPLPDDMNRRTESSSSSSSTSNKASALDFLDDITTTTSLSGNKKKKNHQAAAASSSARNNNSGKLIAPTDLWRERKSGMYPMRASYGGHEYHMLQYLQTAQWSAGYVLEGDEAADAIREWRERANAEMAARRAAAAAAAAEGEGDKKSVGATVTDFFDKLFGKKEGGEASAAAAPSAASSGSNAQEPAVTSRHVLSGDSQSESLSSDDEGTSMLG